MKISWKISFKTAVRGVIAPYRSQRFFRLKSPLQKHFGIDKRTESSVLITIHREDHFIGVDITKTAQKRQDIGRQVMNLFFSIAQFLVTLLPAFGIGVGVGDRAMTSVPQVQPIYWSFFIWFVLYAGCIAYGIYQALPAQRENAVLRRVGFYTASAFIGVTVYALVAQFGGSDWILIGVFIWIFASFLYAIFRLTEDKSHLSQIETYVVFAPISLLTGWVSIAILVNIAAALKTSGIIPAGAIETAFSLLMLLIACIIASGIIRISEGNAWYAFPVMWGLIGVVIANLGEQSNLVVAGFAAFVGLVLLGVLVIVRKRTNEKTVF
jgi:hypothetical protein